jgi:hypothetical protein
MKKLFSCIGLALMAGVLLTGCMTAIKHGDIVSITQAGVGIDVETASASSATPNVRLGFFRTTVNLVPTSTNGPVNVPNVANVAHVDQNGKTLVIGGHESLSTGNYKTYNDTNVVTEPK